MGGRALIAGNWKMHLTIAQAAQLGQTIAALCSEVPDRDVMVAPPFTALSAVAEAARGTALKVAGQNACWEEQGAFTGEISPTMLRDAGATMVIVGHSERRHIFAESDQLINRRVRGALRFGLDPILCVGETLAQREQGTTLQVLEEQIRQGLTDVNAEQILRVVIAYEPVWAIGTGKTASESQAQEVHHFIRKVLGQIFKKDLAESIKILYGGSVKPENIDILMAQPDIDGALVGGAALKFDSFERIVKFNR